MKETAKAICDILHDYHNYKGFEFTVDHVIKWANQFDEGDRAFVLEEFLHLLKNGIYISEEDCKAILLQLIIDLAGRYKVSLKTFLTNTQFLRTQKEGKSQDILLDILNDGLKEHYGLEILEFENPPKVAVYLDDVIGTGGTAFRELLAWLKETNQDGETNYTKVVEKRIKLIVVSLCKHSWVNIDWKLRCELKSGDILEKISYITHYSVQSNPKGYNQIFNLAYPHIDQSEDVKDYLNSLDASFDGEHAFRKDGTPSVEKFYSSPDNRTRFENIILKKGIELLGKASTLLPSQRPLGMTPPRKKTFGTGTLFFTWRNISNTTPIVFWWDGGGWTHLFPLHKRG